MEAHIKTVDKLGWFIFRSKNKKSIRANLEFMLIEQEIILLLNYTYAHMSCLNIN
jgi:hypothetical protein